MKEKRKFFRLPSTAFDLIDYSSLSTNLVVAEMDITIDPRGGREKWANPLIFPKIRKIPAQKWHFRRNWPLIIDIFGAYHPCRVGPLTLELSTIFGPDQPWSEVHPYPMTRDFWKFLHLTSVVCAFTWLQYFYLRACPDQADRHKARIFISCMCVEASPF